MHFVTRNVNDAYSEALQKMRVMGEVSDSRNGKVMRVLGPVITTYLSPQERMLLDPVRDANPFFHIFEGLWMLAGRLDVEFPARFAKQIAQYSDDGKTLHGAYGHRWRNYWDVDQIKWVINLLRRDPTTRRAVINMWDPCNDTYMVDSGGKDVPCNTAIYFNVDQKNRALNMTVCNRSNDIVWGCYGANAVHMSMLHEFVARAAELGVGEYHQFSNDWHIYEQHFHLLNTPTLEVNPYVRFSAHQPITDAHSWKGDLEEFESFVNGNREGFRLDGFVRRVALPMFNVWREYKLGSPVLAYNLCDHILDDAVRQACSEWIGRRRFK